MEYGAQVLSHPLVVEAAETLFVPTCVYNNTEDDHDARVRLGFEEPAWNNPVVRVLDGAGEDLIPRVDRRWSVGGLTGAMVEALGQAGEPVPEWLELVRSETGAEGRTESAIFGMT